MLALLTISSANQSGAVAMSRVQTRETARELLEIVPLVMRTVAAQLRAAGEMPAPAHFGLLSILNERPRMLTELASIQGVSLPTMSNSISAMVERGWVRRTAPESDRRVVILEATVAGRAALERVARAAETHLAELLGPLDAPSRRRLHAGLAVLRQVFAARPAGGPLSRKGYRTPSRRRPYLSQ
jgi:DNA-binding MarR family transcriptional regulator